MDIAQIEQELTAFDDVIAATLGPAEDGVIEYRVMFRQRPGWADNMVMGGWFYPDQVKDVDVSVMHRVLVGNADWAAGHGEWAP